MSLLRPKLTKRLKSEKTSRRCSPREPSATLEPVGGPLIGGEANPANILSATLADAVGLTMPPR